MINNLTLKTEENAWKYFITWCDDEEVASATSEHDKRRAMGQNDRGL